MKKPRCGAKTRRGTPCQASAIWSVKSRRYTRCRNHGGMSTGLRFLPPPDYQVVDETGPFSIRYGQ
jgi:hypothetical protein